MFLSGSRKKAILQDTLANVRYVLYHIDTTDEIFEGLEEAESVLEGVLDHFRCV